MRLWLLKVNHNNECDARYGTVSTVLVQYMKNYILWNFISHFRADRGLNLLWQIKVRYNVLHCDRVQIKNLLENSKSRFPNFNSFAKHFRIYYLQNMFCIPVFKWIAPIFYAHRSYVPGVSSSSNFSFLIGCALTCINFKIIMCGYVTFYAPEKCLKMWFSMRLDPTFMNLRIIKNWIII